MTREEALDLIAKRMAFSEKDVAVCRAALDALTAPAHSACKRCGGLGRVCGHCGSSWSLDHGGCDRVGNAACPACGGSGRVTEYKQVERERDEARAQMNEAYSEALRNLPTHYATEGTILHAVRLLARDKQIAETDLATLKAAVERVKAIPIRGLLKREGAFIAKADLDAALADEKP